LERWGDGAAVVNHQYLEGYAMPPCNLMKKSSYAVSVICGGTTDFLLRDRLDWDSFETVMMLLVRGMANNVKF
jgi:hypothetical protein